MHNPLKNNTLTVTVRLRAMTQADFPVNVSPQCCSTTTVGIFHYLHNASVSQVCSRKNPAFFQIQGPASDVVFPERMFGLQISCLNQWPQRQ